MRKTTADRCAELREHLADLTAEAEKIMTGRFDRESLMTALDLIDDIELYVRDLYSVRRAENAH